MLKSLIWVIIIHTSRKTFYNAFYATITAMINESNDDLETLKSHFTRHQLNKEVQ